MQYIFYTHSKTRTNNVIKIIFEQSCAQGGSCRELLNQSKSLTYLVNAVDELESLTSL